VNRNRRGARLQGLRTAGCACAVALLAGCTLTDNLAMNVKAPHATTDNRILLGATQRITVPQRDVANYTCGNLTLFCTSWGTMYNCYCQ
jgi:hypothetical protein